MVFLAKIETAFNVTSRGCVVVLAALTNPELRVRAGDAVQLRGRNGCGDTRVIAIERIQRQQKECCLGFLLSREIDCSGIGSDTEIWVEQPKQPSYR